MSGFLRMAFAIIVLPVTVAVVVTSGPWAHVRNPMISGVILVLVAEAMLLGSRPHLVWAVAFFLLNVVIIPLTEEPILRARFGDEYREYARHVPRLTPRLTPYRAAKGSRSARRQGE